MMMPGGEVQGLGMGMAMGMGVGVMDALPLHPTVAISAELAAAAGASSVMGMNLNGGGVGNNNNNSNLGGGGSVTGGKKDDRIPQWGFQETKEFIAIRAELEKDFTQTKRNKTLWELISARMREKGFKRSSEQCKCKWKNLVNRYKGKETADPENGRQCPFF
uniref:TSA: Wollemia nobilis Ref_Wollemi_Transcript_11294_1751 transcribed RNA sequence n=1 Tax=Wollemia nobilis TaxID=56998 RepID=A0A0C9RM73_9CONI